MPFNLILYTIKGDFTELAKSVEAARTKNKGQDTSLRVKTIVTQLQEAAAALKILENEKLVEAERSTIMFFKCQDEVGKLVGKHAKKSPLHKSLNNAKDSVRKCVGEYLKLTQGNIFKKANSIGLSRSVL